MATPVEPYHMFDYLPKGCIYDILTFNVGMNVICGRQVDTCPIVFFSSHPYDFLRRWLLLPGRNQRSRTDLRCSLHIGWKHSYPRG